MQLRNTSFEQQNYGTQENQEMWLPDAEISTVEAVSKSPPLPWHEAFLSVLFVGRAHPIGSWPNPLQSEPDRLPIQIGLEMLSLREKWFVSYVESPGCSWISVRLKNLAAYICIPSDCINSVSRWKVWTDSRLYCSFWILRVNEHRIFLST